MDSREAQSERKLTVDTTDAVMFAPPQVDQPIRAEIFGMERLEQHAESLAAAQRTTEKPSRGRNLLARVDDDAKVLLAAYRDIAKTVQEKKEITPAAEWLLDNFHTVDEQIRDIRDHLPKSYYRLLPKIAEGHLAGHPRVYGLAWAYVAHTDSRFQLGTLQPCVGAPTSASSRSPSARGGRSPSTSAWPWWKTCGGWRG